MPSITIDIQNKILPVLAAFFMITSLTGPPLHASTNVRIGIYQNYPLVFTDNNGKTQRIYILRFSKNSSVE